MKTVPVHRPGRPGARRRRRIGTDQRQGRLGAQHRRAAEGHRRLHAITSPQGGKLVGAQSPVAGVTEVHEMAMEGNVMKMRAVSALELPAGKAVELCPAATT